MAEVRKFRTRRGGHIAQAIAQALGESARPITPGASPDPSKTNDSAPEEYAVTATSFVVNDAFLLPASEDDAESESNDGSDS